MLVTAPVSCRPYADRGAEEYGLITHSLRAEGFDASEDGTGRGTPLVPVIAPCLTQNYGKQPDSSDTSAGPMLIPVSIPDVAMTMTPGGEGARGWQDPVNADLVAFNLRGREGGSMAEMAEMASVRAASGGSSRTYVAPQMVVRRLTPTECERLQGLPDGHTQVPYHGKPMADGPRYKMIGNGFAIPVVSWIGSRIQQVEDLK
jgi:DNA (cytosine-5)-methyltransferase 1